MTPLPPPIGPGGIRLWRLDRTRHASTWDSGEGSYIAGGRWNSRGRRIIYCALDPATAILEVAVHKTFRTLDTDPHTLTSGRLTNPALVRRLDPADIPNPNWLVPGVPSSGQQGFGDDLLDRHEIVFVPSVVSRHSWNAIVSIAGRSALDDVQQQPFVLDPRLHPPAS